MRLVRDIDFVLDEEAEPPMHDVKGPARSRRHATPPSNDTLDANEQPDGAVGAAESNDETENAVHSATNASVDLLALEALLFSTHHPLTAGRLAELLGLDSTQPIRVSVHELNRVYEQTGRAFRVEQVAGGYQMLTLPQFGDLLRTMHQKEIDAKLSKPALETLAIIAYKQPILRVDIEAVRGVACGETIRNLMEKHLVKIAGRAEEPGRPILYGTTKRFLEVFGLNSLKDLPQPDSSDAQSTSAPRLTLAGAEAQASPTADSPGSNSSPG